MHGRLRNAFYVVSVLVVMSVLVIFSANLQNRPRTGHGLVSESINFEPMAMSMNYWEQTGCALHNLLDFQCWTSTVNISKVLMPSIEVHGGSVFHFSLNERLLKFEDLFDLDYWNNNSVKVGFSPLVSHEYFMKHASKDIVYVYIRYASSFKCPTLEGLSARWWYKGLVQNGFNFLKGVCIDARRPIKPEAFSDQIFKSLGKRKVSLIFDLWEGIGARNFRIMMRESPCVSSSGKIGNLEVFNSPSSKIGYRYAPANSTSRYAHSKRITGFVDRFLSEHIPEKRYLAIMLRTEKLFMNKKYKAVMARPPESNPCARDIISDWTTMAQANNLSTTLLFSDAGSHGSMSWHSQSSAKFTEYIQANLSVHLTLKSINSAFENMTSSKNSVQIAALNQALVARATCAIIVGGGAFQGMALNMYAYNHRGQECYVARDSFCAIAGAVTHLSVS